MHINSLIPTSFFSQTKDKIVNVIEIYIKFNDIYIYFSDIYINAIEV